MSVSKDKKKIVAVIMGICMFMWIVVLFESDEGQANDVTDDKVAQLEEQLKVEKEKTAELEEEIDIQKDASSKMAYHIEMLEAELEKQKKESVLK